MAYKLYVGALAEYKSHNRYVFYNAENGYVLVYSTKKPQGNFYEVTEEISNELSPIEQEWLKNIYRETHINVDEFSKLVDEFEKNLKQIKEEYIGGNEK